MMHGQQNVKFYV